MATVDAAIAIAYEADDHGVIIKPQKPLCKRCYRGLQTKGGNTSNLAKHLKDRHPDLFKEFMVSSDSY